MLPDLWRMADRRMRARRGVRSDEPELGALLRGIEHHLEVDAWFHAHPAFRNGERRLMEAFRGEPIRASKMGLFGHIGWELCLDGALLRRRGIDATSRALRASTGDGRRGLLERAARLHRPELETSGGAGSLGQRLDDLLRSVVDSDWVPGYAHGEGLVDRVAGIRRRVGLDPIDERDRTRLAGIFDRALDEAEGALDELEAVETCLD